MFPELIWSQKKSTFQYCNELFLLPPPHSIMSRICKAIDFCYSLFPLYIPPALKHSHPMKPSTFVFKVRTKKLDTALIFTWRTYYSHSSSFESHEILLHILLPHYFFCPHSLLLGSWQSKNINLDTDCFHSRFTRGEKRYWET